MLSADLYEISENNSITNDEMRALQEVHRPIVFENAGFTTRANHIFDLMDIVDVMQDSRFDPYMNELCGFSDDELEIYLSAANALVDFQQNLFQIDKIVVPFDALTSHFSLFLKISGFKKFERVLEIGPGCGYLSLFLNADQRNKYYCQVETTQIFYLLQSQLGSFLYGGDFLEGAHPGHLLGNGVKFGDEEYGVTFESQKRSRYMEHVPWWETANFQREKFDIITMNAMLCELSKNALDLYLDIALNNLKDDGFLVVQCIGAAHDSTGPEMQKSTASEMLNAVIRKGFSIQFFVFDYKTDGGRHTVENMVLVKNGHPLYSPYEPGTLQLPIQQEQNELFSTYYRNKDDVKRRKYTKGELMELLKKRSPHLA